MTVKRQQIHSKYGAGNEIANQNTVIHQSSASFTPILAIVLIFIFQWEDGTFQIAVSGCFYGVLGEIRTPDPVIRSHALN